MRRTGNIFLLISIFISSFIFDFHFIDEFQSQIVKLGYSLSVVLNTLLNERKAASETIRSLTKKVRNCLFLIGQLGLINERWSEYDYERY